MTLFGVKRSCLGFKQLHGRKYSARLYTVNGFRAQTVKRKLPRTFFVLGIISALLAISLTAMLGVRQDTVIAEWWTRNVQAGWEKAIGTITSWLPFSVFELFVVIAILVGVFLLVRFIVNLCVGKFRCAAVGLLSVGIVALYMLNMYIMSMGFGYYRAPMPIPQAGEKYTEAQTIAAAEYFMTDYSRLAEKFERDENGCVVCPYTFSELADLMIAEYARIDDDYFAAYTPKAKPIVNSGVLSSMLITGITFLPFGESTVNTEAPPTGIAATMAHELAHAKGVQREGDANLMSYYVLVSSDNEYLRYCGYYASFNNLLSAIMLFDNRDEYRRLYNGVSDLVYRERAYANKFWNNQPDIIGQISEFFNDMYLTLNGAFNGTGSYNDGNKSDIIITVDPDTGEQQKRIVFSQTQKMFFALYETAVGHA